MPRNLFTVGYEGTNINGFIANLLTNSVDCVLDVRQLPLSRKPGFSKNELAQRLNRAKIQYVHLADLGTPKPIRQKLKSTRDYSTFFKKMDAYLAARKDAIETAYKYAMNNICCLMCFEHLAAKCHRKLIAKKIKQRNGNGLQIIHL
ncbi:MAG: DUF488 domain-containing protein [Planctomycetota bacterium]|nr:MAG: DUF488 domain-containing protein [Planctomycetota bacterium]